MNSFSMLRHINITKTMKFPLVYSNLTLLRSCTAKVRKKRVDGHVIPEIKEYLKSKPCLKVVSDFIPERFLRMKHYPSYYSFVVDDEIAESIMEKIKNELVGDTPIIETNPGLGLLTRHMLKAGAKKLLVFDSMFNPLPPLQQLITDNPERITIIPSNMFEVYNVLAQDKMDNGDRFDTMFKIIPFRRWCDEPAVKVVGVLQTINYLRYLIRCIAFNETIIKMGRIINIVVVTDNVYKKLVNSYSSGRMQINLLFNHFFEMETLAKFPRMAFLPWDKQKVSTEVTARVVYLLKITPKSDIFERYSEDELKMLWYFIQSLCRCKKNRVIGFFENWVPSSGLVLIREGLNPLTEVGDLKPPEVFQLFRIFTSLPDFDEANFIHIHESGLLSESPVEDDQSLKPLNQQFHNNQARS